MNIQRRMVSADLRTQVPVPTTVRTGSRKTAKLFRALLFLWRTHHIRRAPERTAFYYHRRQSQSRRHGAQRKKYCSMLLHIQRTVGRSRVVFRHFRRQHYCHCHERAALHCHSHGPQQSIPSRQSGIYPNCRVTTVRKTHAKHGQNSGKHPVHR